LKLFFVYFIEIGTNPRFFSKVSPETDMSYLLTPLQNNDLDIPRQTLNTLRTGDADLRLYITTVQDG